MSNTLLHLYADDLPIKLTDDVLVKTGNDGIKFWATEWYMLDNYSNVVHISFEHNNIDHFHCFLMETQPSRH